MHVTHLSLSDYRNYAGAELALEPGATVLMGDNGQGKTNLVEALGFLATARSHRTSSDRALIRAGSARAIIRARLRHGEREVLVEVEINTEGPNRARVNGSAVRPRELPRSFSSVLFAPEDLSLVRGEPAGRRRFLDELLVQDAPRFAGIMADYDRVVKQRNTLLKSLRGRRLPEGALATLEVWDEKLVGLGAQIVEARSALLERLGPPLAEAYRSVAGADHAPVLTAVRSILGEQVDAAGVAHTTGDPAQGAETGADPSTAMIGVFRAALEEVRPRELERGLSLVGPHRDDVFFGLNALPVKGYASHGESWSYALALRVASAQLLRTESSSGDPVLILDDVFAELDEDRRERLAASVADYEQVIVTAAVRDAVPESLAAHTVGVRAGVLTS